MSRRTKERPVYKQESGIQHTCTICGKVGPWSDTWRWWGSIKESEASGAMIKICSDECNEGLTERYLHKLLASCIEATKHGETYVLRASPMPWSGET